MNYTVAYIHAFSAAQTAKSGIAAIINQRLLAIWASSLIAQVWGYR